MISDQMLAFETDCHLFQDCGFPAPSVWSFIFEPMFTVGPVEVNKAMVLAFISTALVVGFFWKAFARPKVVPGKFQLLAEVLYDFVRRGIGREVIGKKAEPFVPLLVSLFFFIWIMNIWAVIPKAACPAGQAPEEAHQVRQAPAQGALPSRGAARQEHQPHHRQDDRDRG